MLTQGQWWSIFRTHAPQTLQWCARSGLITKHLSQYLSEPFIVLQMFRWKFILKSIITSSLHTYRLLIGKSFANISRIRFCSARLSACASRSISVREMRNYIEMENWLVVARRMVSQDIQITFDGTRPNVVKTVCQ